MNQIASRKSWHSSLKIAVKYNLHHNALTIKQLNTIGKANIHRWKHENDGKYLDLGMEKILQQNILILEKYHQNPFLKRSFDLQIKLLDTLFSILKPIRGMKKVFFKHRNSIVQAVENAKNFIPTSKAIAFFNLSTSTYAHYKSLVLHQCSGSPIHFCQKKYPQQLLKQELIQIKAYLSNPLYASWSKVSIYLLALRNGDFAFSLNSFYKYAQLLGYESNRHIYKYPDYSPLSTTKPNQFWCADVTILKLLDHSKLYIHLLIDHFSKKILDFRVDTASKAKNITQMVQDTHQKLDAKPTNLFILTDDGTENQQLKSILETKHLIAQKDIQFSNSMIESVNKVIKHQFLLPLKLQNSHNFIQKLTEIIHLYNHVRPQLILGGNTPSETYDGKTTDLNQYKDHFATAKAERIAKNKNPNCKICTN